MPKYLSGEDPPKKKSPIEAALASAVQRPDALPRAPKPRMIPEFYVNSDTTQALEGRLSARAVPDPDEIKGRFPFPTPLTESKVPGTLWWQHQFLDTLAQVVGDEPGKINGFAFPANYVTGVFRPKGRTISVGGNIIPGDAAMPEQLRWSLSHEFAHLLTHNDNRILQAFMSAAPLPKRVNEIPGDDFNKAWTTGFETVREYGQPIDIRQIVDTSRTPSVGPREFLSNEAFADMFADALASRFPNMEGGRTRKLAHYPFTDQFRGRSRQVMMDSLVNSLTERLKQ